MFQKDLFTLWAIINDQSLEQKAFVYKSLSIVANSKKLSWSFYTDMGKNSEPNGPC